MISSRFRSQSLWEIVPCVSLLIADLLPSMQFTHSMRFRWTKRLVVTQESALG